jgi:hypothetical protein
LKCLDSNEGMQPLLWLHPLFASLLLWFLTDSGPPLREGQRRMYKLNKQFFLPNLLAVIVWGDQRRKMTNFSAD